MRREWSSLTFATLQSQIHLKIHQIQDSSSSYPATTSYVNLPSPSFTPVFRIRGYRLERGEKPWIGDEIGEWGGLYMYKEEMEGLEPFHRPRNLVKITVFKPLILPSILPRHLTPILPFSSPHNLSLFSSVLSPSPTALLHVVTLNSFAPLIIQF